jgi:hypothetical protein
MYIGHKTFYGKDVYTKTLVEIKDSPLTVATWKGNFLLAAFGQRPVFKVRSFRTLLQELWKPDRFKEYKNIFARKKRRSFFSFWRAIREVVA